ncbi:MAG: polysaccharide deacetylase, partial [Lachnospiraceae bacterium]|nr:polysaccharide deacetylase [Lachnospiraceae bacterium]
LDPYIDRDSWVMNYPYGSYSDDTVEYIKSKGAVLGLTADVRIADLSVDDLWRLPRLDCNDFPPKSENYLSI